jgi:exodeoxyribonuclease VII large subunit
LRFRDGKIVAVARQTSLLDALLEPSKPISVSELTGRIKQTLESQFAEVWVEGEISNFKRHSSGHWYFTLKDAGAQVRCASFRNSNRYVRFEPHDGLAVRVRGRVSLYEPRGEYQILVASMEPVGVGALQLAFEQLKARLAAEHLFDLERKRPLPLLPRCVGIVTSPTGAAIRDMLRVLRRRNMSVRVLVAPVRVQGDGAAREIARAIEMLSSSGLVDVIIAGRGGGSLEDLWAFNEEAVARAIFASRVPVISAVGHETDVTIADFVADVRAPTPSVAAELVASAAGELRETIRQRRRDAVSAIRFRLLDARSSVRELRHDPALTAVPSRLARLIQQVDDARDHLWSSTEDRLGALRATLARHGTALAAADPRRRVLEDRARVASLASRVETLGRAAVDERRERLALLAGALSSLSPLDVLMRGYALVRDEAGHVVRSPDDVAPGERMLIRVADGELTAVRVDDDETGEGERHAR